MDDRFGPPEMMRYSIMNGGSMPPCGADSLLGRLDEIDVRLRQLEEKQRLLPGSSSSSNSSYFTADLWAATARQHRPCCMSLSSALHEVHIKGTLLDRLHLLEARIRMLSHELNKGSGFASTSTPTTVVNDNGWLQPIVAAPDKPQQNSGGLCSTNRMVVGGPRRNGELFQRTARPKAKAKDSREAIEAAEKRATTAMCRDEKRRMERTRIYKKWFPVGC